MTIKTITDEMKSKLRAPLPAEAVTEHPTKPYLSNIKAIYVAERLNDVFGFGSWSMDATETATQEVASDKKAKKMVVLKVTLEIPEYGLKYSSFGGNDNEDLGDAYKGAMTDALTKIASTYLEVGMDVFKGLQTGKKKTGAKTDKVVENPNIDPDLGF